MANTINKTKTHCLRGHPLISGNLVLSALKQGKRSCKICRQIFDKKKRNPDGNVSPAVLNSKKIFCKNGHPLIEPNLLKYELKHGKRSCKICKNQSSRIRNKTPERKKYQKDWLSNNRSKSRGYTKKWRLANPEKAKQWDKDHPESKKQRWRKHEKNPARIAYRKNWIRMDYKKNPEKTLEKNIRTLERLGEEVDKSSNEYKRALQAWSKTTKKMHLECAICGSKTNLKSHHLLFKALYPKLSFNMNNAIVLCREHHDEVHLKNLHTKTFHFYKSKK